MIEGKNSYPQLSRPANAYSGVCVSSMNSLGILKVNTEISIRAGWLMIYNSKLGFGAKALVTSISKCEIGWTVNRKQ